MSKDKMPISTGRIARHGAVLVAALCSSMAVATPSGPPTFKVAPPANWKVPFSGGSVAVTVEGGNAPVNVKVLDVAGKYAPYIVIADAPEAGGGTPAPKSGTGVPGLPAPITVSKVLKLLPLPSSMRVPGSQFSVTVRAQDASGAAVSTPVQVNLQVTAGIPVISSAKMLGQRPTVNPDSSSLFALQISNFSPDDAEREIICRYSYVHPGSTPTEPPDHLCPTQPQGSTIVVRVPDRGRAFSVQLLAKNREGFSTPVTVEPRGTEIQVAATQEFGLREQMLRRGEAFQHRPPSSSVSGRMLPSSPSSSGACGRQYVVWAAENPVTITNLRTEPADILPRVTFTPFLPGLDVATRPVATGGPKVQTTCLLNDPLSYAPAAVNDSNLACGSAIYDSNGRDPSTADRLIFDVTYRLGVREMPPCERPAN